MSTLDAAPSLHFEAPPLNEVVLGVQFAPSANYRLVRAGEVWSLYRDRFPLVQEQGPIAPAFETFGAPQVRTISFELMQGAPQTRFWFLTKTEAELIQFQPDRLLHNWRKIEGVEHPYPRFENMIAEFEREIIALNGHFAALDGTDLQINQCEVTYINQIALDSPSDRPQDWLRFVRFETAAVENLAMVFTQVITSLDGQPIGRLVCEAKTAYSPEGGRVLLLQITGRGAPNSPSISSAIQFLKVGREKVGQLFLETTTDAAHAFWGRVT